MKRTEAGLLLAVVGVGSFAYFKVGEPGRREESRRNCLTNLKKIGLGFMQYAQDYDNTYPRAWFGHDVGPSDARVNYKWMDAIFPYVKEEKLFHCPSDTTNAPYRFRSGTNYGSYVINNAYSQPGDAWTPPAGIRVEKLASPNYTVLVTDGEGSFQCTWPDPNHTPEVSGDNPFHFDTIRGRHSEGLYHSVAGLDSGGMTSTAVLGFVRDTKTIRGQKIYYKFTVEDD